MLQEQTTINTKLNTNSTKTISLPTVAKPTIKDSSKKKKFRLQGKNLFLTYSQTDLALTREDILNQLSKLLCIKGYLIAQELHQNGGTHFHVVVSLKKRCDIRNPKALDLLFNNKIYHGNYQVARNTNATKEYVLKTDKECIYNDAM